MQEYSVTKYIQKKRKMKKSYINLLMIWLSLSTYLRIYIQMYIDLMKEQDGILSRYFQNKMKTVSKTH